MASQWYPLGLQLKLRTGTLDSIRVELSAPNNQLREMLKTWLATSDNTSWKTLIDALKSRSVGARQLASVLETKYCLLEVAELERGIAKLYFALLGCYWSVSGILYSNRTHDPIQYKKFNSENFLMQHKAVLIGLD